RLSVPVRLRRGPDRLPARPALCRRGLRRGHGSGHPASRLLPLHAAAQESLRRQPPDPEGQGGRVRTLREVYTMATWIVGGALAIIVGAIVFKMVRDKRNGKGGCSCNCGGCGGCGGCRHEQAK